MYGIVLVMALGQGTAVPDFGHRGGGGCCGCHGGGWGGCYGGGCYGGGWGGCYGGGWGGCYGGGWGGMSFGCWGGSYPVIGSGCLGTNLSTGGIVTSPGQMNVAPGGGGVTPGVTDDGGKMKIKEEDKPGRPNPNPGGGRKKTTEDEAQGIRSAPVTIIVSLPADARLFFDDQPTQSSGARRVFTTPPLESDRTYHYQLRTQIVQDGQVNTVTRSVPVLAGETTYVTINASNRQVVAIQR